MILAEASGRAERNLWFSAMLAREAKAEITIVGGSAIDVYTNGRYVTGDIDLVGERRRIIQTLEGWGFRREGRLWSRSDLRLWVDPVGKYYTGDPRRLRQVSTPYGSVRLASVEDLIANRLVGIKVWPGAGTELLDQAVALAAEYQDELDWEYVARMAAQDHAEDLVPKLLNRINPPERRPSPAGQWETQPTPARIIGSYDPSRRSGPEGLARLVSAMGSVRNELARRGRPTGLIEGEGEPFGRDRRPLPGDRGRTKTARARARFRAITD